MRRMAKIKCKPVGPGEWQQPIRKNYLLQCCDCDLVHSLDFRLLKDGRGNFIQFRAFRVDKNGKRILGTGDATGKEKCGQPAAPFIPRWGMSFSCALPKGHKGDHQQGGNCFAHGEYIGKQCPQWPSCAQEILEKK